MTLSILGWPWKKIVKAIIVVATWVLSLLPDDPSKPAKP